MYSSDNTLPPPDSALLSLSCLFTKQHGGLCTNSLSLLVFRCGEVLGYESKHLPVEPCAQPLILPATGEVIFKYTSFLTWSIHCYPPVCRPASVPYPSLHHHHPGWVFSSRSQTNLKSFLISGCIWITQCSDGFKCVKINGVLSSLAWSVIVSPTHFAEVQLLVWELTWITKDLAAAALWNAIKKQFCLLYISNWSALCKSHLTF